ncbi:MAG: hypothetical protein ACXWXS_00935 [Actinomycetota bacterium]
MTAWSLKKCLDKAGVIGLMLKDLGADDAVTYSLQKAEDHGCDIHSPEFDRAMREGFERAESVEDDLAALAECDQVQETIYEARQVGDLVTARRAERYYERHCV